MIKRRGFLAAALGLFGIGLGGNPIVTNSDANNAILEKENLPWDWPEYKALLKRLELISETCQVPVLMDITVLPSKKRLMQFQLGKSKGHYLLDEDRRLRIAAES